MKRIKNTPVSYYTVTSIIKTSKYVNLFLIRLRAIQI